MRRRPPGAPLLLPLLLDLLLLLLLCAPGESLALSPPGKPVLLGCRSPEKETFTCWWKPGSDGRLRTVHRLHYEREDLEGARECPDYQSGGENSCFFDKNHTSIWVYYYLTVVASNSLGNVSSDTLKLDVMDIVRPDAPENVVVQVEDTEDSPHLHVWWQRPSNTNTRSGWVTIKYQLRVKQESGNEWNNYTSGTQTDFSLYSVRPGLVYVVQVRCALDHSSWSEWSNVTAVTVPNYVESERPFWTLLSTLSVVSLFATMCVLFLKRKDVKQILLPPVPSPKIKGVTLQLLQSGRSGIIVNALIFNEHFPPMAGRKDQMEEYLLVSERDGRPWLDRSSPVQRTTCVSLPASCCIDSEMARAQLTRTQRDLKESEESIGVTDLLGAKCHWKETEGLSWSKQESTRGNFENTNSVDQSKGAAEGTVHPLVNSSGYVAVQRHVGATQGGFSRVSSDNVPVLEKESVPPGLDAHRGEDSVTEGYSRVEEVKSDNMLLLHKQSDLSCPEKKKTYTEGSNQKPGPPHVAAPSNTGFYTELTGNGYIESVPSA